VISWFQSFAFKCNLYRYSEAATLTEEAVSAAEMAVQQTSGGGGGGGGGLGLDALYGQTVRGGSGAGGGGESSSGSEYEEEEESSSAVTSSGTKNKQQGRTAAGNTKGSGSNKKGSGSGTRKGKQRRSRAAAASPASPSVAAAAAVVAAAPFITPPVTPTAGGKQRSRPPSPSSPFAAVAAAAETFETVTVVSVGTSPLVFSRSSPDFTQTPPHHQSTGGTPHTLASAVKYAAAQREAEALKAKVSDLEAALEQSESRMEEELLRAVSLTKRLETPPRAADEGEGEGEGEGGEETLWQATLAEREAQVATLRAQLREVTAALDSVSGDKKRLEGDMSGRETVVDKLTRQVASLKSLAKVGGCTAGC
jgi:hypothetical protein